VSPHLPFLALHILAGSVSLVTSVVALVATKGGRVHVRAGQVFVAAMIVVGLSAFILAVLRPNPFLFAVGVFSLYLAIAGREAAAVRTGIMSRTALVAAILMVVVGIGMVAIGGGALAGIPAAAAVAGRLPVVLLAFGLGGTALATQDLRTYAAGREAPQRRIARHVGRIVGATIASWTAFVVVNLTFLPPLARWLGPSLLFAPLILYWNIRLLRRGARRAQPAGAGSLMRSSG
jgi:uncharacterized membrane protein